jgi:hypothetical protein
MSFRIFIYSCALCGAWAAFVGWAAGSFMADHLPRDTSALARTLLKGASLGTALAIALGFVDALWNRSGHQAAPVVGRSLLVGLLGCVCSLFGVGIGQMLYHFTELEPLRIFGWALTGLLIGASIAVLDLILRLVRSQSAAGQFRKMSNGLLGGFLGGLLGGLLSAGVSLLLSRVFHKEPDELLSSSAWGFVVLGTCIGLFVGLAQVILKEGWLRVEAGFRAGREILLTKEEVLIGRAEVCDIGLFGDSNIERAHARIFRQNNRYILVDEGTPAGTFVNDQRVTQPTRLKSGDAIRLGSTVLRFGERQRKEQQ